MVDLLRGALPEQLADDVRALARRVEQHDGVEAFGEQTLLDLSTGDDRVRHLLVAEPLSLAYAQVRIDGRPPSGELAVDPDARRRGLGAALLSTVRTLTEHEGAPSPAMWAHGDLPAAQALAASAGMAAVRELWRMSRGLGDGPAAPPPRGDGVVVRPFVVGQDESAWLHLNARAFAAHPEQGRMTMADLQAREREPWFDPADLLLAEQGETLVASAWIKIEPGEDAGELYALAVDPDAQGRGLGRWMTALTLDHLTRRGLDRAVLYTEADNTGAVRTYAAAGFTTDRVDVQYR